MELYVTFIQISDILIGFFTLRVLVIPLWKRTPTELDERLTPKNDHVIICEYRQDSDVLLDEFERLDIDLAVGGTDQRKVHMLAREKLPELGYEARPCLHTPILADLETGKGKMSSSVGTTISMEDSTAELARKIESAFCPPTR